MLLTMTFCVILPSNASAGTPVGGYIDSDTTWVIEGSPYWVESNVTVRNGANLTIEVGVDVLFNGSYSRKNNVIFISVYLYFAKSHGNL